MSPSIPPDAICCFRDGSAWMAVKTDFHDLMTSPAGFGSTLDEAHADLLKSIEKWQAR